MPPKNDKVTSRISDDFNPVKDEKRTFRSELEKMKGMGFKDRLSYFWMYYKLPVIIIIISIIFIVSVISSVMENKKPVLIAGSIINNYTEKETMLQDFENDFCTYMGEDPDKVNISLDTSLAFYEDDNGGQNQTVYYKLLAEISANTLDFLGGDSIVFKEFNDNQGDNAYCEDLEAILPADMISALQDKFYYMKTDDGSQIPVGVDISQTGFYQDMGFQGKECYIGFIVSSENRENFIAFLRYVFEI